MKKLSRNEWIAVAAALAVVVALFGFPSLLMNNDNSLDFDDSSPGMDSGTGTATGGFGETPASPNEALQITDTKAGTGAQAKTGDTVTVHYTGTFQDGTPFDSSRSHGQPFTLTLGEGRVIPGWELGLIGMKEGGTRRLVIGPELAYGAAGVPGAIPADATLVFDIELLDIK
jgi:FKBP-type peptidyl-prolyl cis-trans isomerase FkpA